VTVTAYTGTKKKKTMYNNSQNKIIYFKNKIYRAYNKKVKE